MSALILDGREVARAVRAEVMGRVAALAERGFGVGLATVLVGDDQASHVYVRNKRRLAEEVGIRSFHHPLPGGTSQEELGDLIRALNADDAVDGILVQLPLPSDLVGEHAVLTIDPAKDVDGLHPINLGRMILDRSFLVPCTPSACLRILSHYDIPVSGAEVVVVGRSLLVGRPLSMLLAAKGVDATVTVAHSRTPDLAAVTRRADIIVAAVGVPQLLGAAHIRQGATVIDVGINRVDGKLVGDVDFEELVEVAGAITPVPGGVGPMTVAMLMENTVSAAEARRS